MQKKIMIFGANGQLGRELSLIYKDAILLSHRKEGCENGIEFSNSDEIKKAISYHEPEVIINAVALTNVDKCEMKQDLAYAINSHSVNVIAKECNRRNIKLVQVSTDYVFDGKVGRYNEESLPNPINYYGLSKLIGDNFAQMSEDSIIVRTSGVFGYSNNYPKFVYNALVNNQPIKAIEGLYSPIHAANLAHSIFELINIGYKGIINIAGERISRYDLALKISDYFNIKGNIEEVSAVKNMVAKRPYDSSLEIALAKNIIKRDFFSLKSNLAELERTINEGNE